ncbi:TRNAHis guanylyltransferase [Rasamsonia emersonii CBS 393.64]|uniref:tRNA(His) guanylyltransferase n=1 Tax=Rasamsonia emersonii (strain ATCC 16479 / CBS 393.64 / IMI 116815) TaxID=1408163 RepID=A0A0F4Z1K8_RASE3|nr:TRNAHis guanylyltransferase [Rasamsonia emersonii CBS 393.64]KKA24235.1 TRNAHis guanylyltransferase [Rasamsonia emersonii CBS 393.64]
MANSKYEYVKSFEQSDVLLPDTWIVVRIDGRGFHNDGDAMLFVIRLLLSDKYGFEKPNDRRALDLMNAAAVDVMKELPDLNIAYGVSDEYRWPTYFPSTPLEPPHLPTFDGRAVLYPTTKTLRDYMSWRQVDCHINNLYNTTFWALVQKGGMSNADAEKELQGTVSSDKNEILFKRFGINYNNEPEMYKKGSVVYRQYQLEEPNTGAGASEEQQPSSAAGDKEKELSRSQQDKLRKLRQKAKVVVEHVDIIKDDFWARRPWILSNRPGKLPVDS